MEVDRFLSDSYMRFSETSIRPPIPGEENELVSNGGNSTKSNTSQKTANSNQSDKSNKSKSPAATPRRSNLDKTSISLTCAASALNDDHAPLGFEPEGSEETRCRNESMTPSYRKWAESLECLLDDGEGVKLFKVFLDQEHSVHTLDFLFACRGIRLPAHNDDKIANLSKKMFNRYLRGNAIAMDPKIKRDIALKLKENSCDRTIFDAAEAYVENSMRKDTYPLFLNSDVYLQYVQAGGESPKSSHSTSGSNSVRPMSTGPLVTLHEEKELNNEDLASSLQLSISQASILPLNSESLDVTIGMRSRPTRYRLNPQEG